MKLYDISQKVFSCFVYPGDPSPVMEPVIRMTDGEMYNLSAFSMCAHNGTHVDAPYHFINDGKTIDKIGLEAFVGEACVIVHQGVITDEDAKNIINKALKYGKEYARRILFKGDIVMTTEAAEVFAASDILLLGTESQSIGPIDAPMAVHVILLNKEIVPLEGIRLGEVSEGAYILNAAPLNLEGIDGAPCRAVLMEM